MGRRFSQLLAPISRADTGVGGEVPRHRKPFPNLKSPPAHAQPLLSSLGLQAPDFPGFGFTEIPDARKYEFTTANILQTLEALLDSLEITSFAIYLHDYGAPVGMRFVPRSRPSSLSRS